MAKGARSSGLVRDELKSARSTPTRASQPSGLAKGASPKSINATSHHSTERATNGHQTCGGL